MFSSARFSLVLEMYDWVRLSKISLSNSLFKSAARTWFGSRVPRLVARRRGAALPPCGFLQTRIPRLRVNTGKQRMVLETRVPNLPYFSNSARYLQHFCRVP